MQLPLSKPRVSMFNTGLDNRNSLFGSSVKTESTNIHSESTVTLNNADNSFNTSFAFGRRTSIQFNLNRRQTVPAKNTTTAGQDLDRLEECKEEIRYGERQSIESLNDRASQIEGQTNTPNTDNLMVKSRSAAVTDPITVFTSDKMKLEFNKTVGSNRLPPVRTINECIYEDQPFSPEDKKDDFEGNVDVDENDQPDNRKIYTSDSKSMKQVQNQGSPRQ